MEVVGPVDAGRVEWMNSEGGEEREMAGGRDRHGLGAATRCPSRGTGAEDAVEEVDGAVIYKSRCQCRAGQIGEMIWVESAD